MCFTFKKNNKQTKKPVNCFLQDDASAGIQSQTSIEINPAKTHGTDYRHSHFMKNGLETHQRYWCILVYVFVHVFFVGIYTWENQI